LIAHGGMFPALRRLFTVEGESSPSGAAEFLSVPGGAIHGYRRGMEVSRMQIIARGLSNRCPNCGGHTLFQAGSFFKVNPVCPRCGLRIERDEGSYLGAMSLNFGVTLVGFLTPVMLLIYYDVLGTTVGVALAFVGALIFPALFYRSSRSWWLMNYYAFLPHHLPANQTTLRPSEDENT
jgi:uncharacterized protein (DUF983 family)